ncbi:hypothetical protein [Streptomyces sp. PRh5]|uniref:hypothetical protein n=1 Tax=Streptomyces sp. PRh5 TaxID=1158056 RepID=UPI0012FEDD7C|nr:hypothetical protein [Streptomyces sp. PRh5]
MAVAFAARALGWTSHGSSIACWRQVRVFAKFVSGLACPPDHLDGLTAAMLKRWRAAQIDTNDGKKTLVTVRAFLLRDPRLATGAVTEELAKHIPGRQVMTAPPGPSQCLINVAVAAPCSGAARCHESSDFSHSAGCEG